MPKIEKVRLHISLKKERNKKKQEKIKKDDPNIQKR